MVGVLARLAEVLEARVAWSRRRRPAAAAARRPGPASPSVSRIRTRPTLSGRRPMVAASTGWRGRLEQVDRADVGLEPALDQVDDVVERFGRVAAVRDEPADLLERPEQRLIIRRDLFPRAQASLRSGTGSAGAARAKSLPRSGSELGGIGRISSVLFDMFVGC